MTFSARLILFLAGLAGAGGVAAGAAAAHGGYVHLDTVSLYLLVHGAALLALALAPAPGRLVATAALVMALGVVLFCGDLALRGLAGIAPVPMAAPAGGLLMMAGWIGLAAAALLPRQSQG